jgi:hypothetical protein
MYGDRSAAVAGGCELSLYAIRFKKDSQVRYLIETQGNPEYNAIDSGNLGRSKEVENGTGRSKVSRI